MRLEEPHRSAVQLAPDLQLLELLVDELLDLARLQLGDHRALEVLEQARVAADQAAVEQRRARGVVFARQRERLPQRAGGESGLQPGVPQGPVQALGGGVPARPLRGRGILPRKQGEQIDVAARRQLPPAVSAGGDQRYPRKGRALQLAGDSSEHLLHHLVGERGDRTHDLLAARPAAMPPENLRPARFEADARRVGRSGWLASADARARGPRLQCHGRSIAGRASCCARSDRIVGPGRSRSVLGQRWRIPGPRTTPLRDADQAVGGGYGGFFGGSPSGGSWRPGSFRSGSRRGGSFRSGSGVEGSLRSGAGGWGSFPGRGTQEL